ncbi:DUF4357 domain-containing protein [Patescibacteria group bacterium]|nr:DUF4357 domain-containing protein [Patescibacteria group bacterium]
MPKIIDADELTIEALLNNPKNVYVVPNHQRQFEWTKEQWGDLWNDINLGKIEDSHFLGSIVVIPSDRPKVGINYFEVNDGQQRLTTVLILLSAIRDFSKQLGGGDLAKFISDNYLFSNYFDEGSRKEILKMKLGKLDNEEFEKVLSGRLQNNHTPNSHRIFECYDYFISAMSDYTAQELEELKNRVVEKIIIVHINVADKLNAFRLFETLNDRGLALSAVDLIKNHLLMKASSNGNDEVVDSIVEEWIEMYEKIRDYDPVTFFYRFMLSEYPGKISARQLYEEVTQKARNWGSDEIVSFTKKLNEAATVYTELINGRIGNLRVDRRLQDIRLFEAGPSYTLLLKITPLLKNGILSEDQYLKVVDFIESFHIRWGICGQSTSRLNDIYNQMCTRLKFDDPNEILSYIENSYLSWAVPINDSAFSTSFKEKFAQFSASRTKYIIWKLGKPAGEVSLNFDEVHTEHILPQTLNSGWILELEKSTEMSKEEIKNTHDLLINKIGNFALIKGEWNISMSNRVFSEKKESYVRSEIQLTKELAAKREWTFNDIIERTDALADIAIQIWKFDKPIPEVNVGVKTLTMKYSVSDSIELFCKAQNVLATAHIINQSTVRVHKGSSARKETVPSFEHYNYYKLREDLIRRGILIPEGDYLVFTQDYDFDSLSAAAAVVLGMTSNGKNDWKDEAGVSVDKIMEGDNGGIQNTNKEPEGEPTGGERIYDKEYYVSHNYDKDVAGRFFNVVNRIEVIIKKNNWNLQTKFNKNYVAFKLGKRQVFIVWWNGKKSFGMSFKMDSDKASEFSKIYTGKSEWDEHWGGERIADAKGMNASDLENLLKWVYDLSLEKHK